MGFDYGEAEAWQVSTVLPIGNHVITIDDALSDFNRNNNPEIQLWISNNAGNMRDWVAITEKSIGKVAALFDAAGVQRPQPGEFDPQTGKLTQQCVDRLKGKKAGVVVREEPDFKDPSIMRNRPAGYVPVSQIGGMPGGGSASSAPSTSPAAARKTADAIPFLWDEPDLDQVAWHAHENR